AAASSVDRSAPLKASASASLPAASSPAPSALREVVPPSAAAAQQPAAAAATEPSAKLTVVGASTNAAVPAAPAVNAGPATGQESSPTLAASPLVTPVVATTAPPQHAAESSKPEAQAATVAREVPQPSRTDTAAAAATCVAPSPNALTSPPATPAQQHPRG